jgi:LacI family transcriptional regulator
LERGGSINIKEIARLTSVHPSTVSRALNGSLRVKPETRKRIEEIALEGGYIRDSLAKSLIIGKTFTVGILVPEISSTFYSRIIDEIETGISVEGYGIILAATNFQYPSERKALNSMLSKRVDALVICAPSDRILDDYLNIRINTPIVLCDTTRENLPLNDVYEDEKKGIREAVLYLAGLGHRDIGFIAEENLTSHRLDNFMKVMKKCALKPDPDWIRLESETGPECGYKTMKRFFSKNRFPTAVLCARDTIAIGAMRAVVEKGLRVPKFISIVGYDDIEISQYLQPALTTVRQSSEEIGRQVGKMLLELIHSDSKKDDKTHIVLKPRLVVRESTAAPRKR